MKKDLKEALQSEFLRACAIKRCHLVQKKVKVALFSDAQKGEGGLRKFIDGAIMTPISVEK